MKFPGVRAACTDHIVKSSKVVRSLGLTVSQFNAISRRLESDSSLRERVMEQAYLYRLAAAMKFDRIPLLEDPAAGAVLAAHKRRRVHTFARSLATIEALREEQTDQLKRALNVRSLPSNFRVCDPNVLPFLSPKIQSVCADFPVLAEAVVKKHGLGSDEFNGLLAEARRNPAFRWRVQRYVKSIKQGDRNNRNGGEEKKK